MTLTVWYVIDGQAPRFMELRNDRRYVHTRDPANKKRIKLKYVQVIVCPKVLDINATKDRRRAGTVARRLWLCRRWL